MQARFAIIRDAILVAEKNRISHIVVMSASSTARSIARPRAAAPTRTPRRHAQDSSRRPPRLVLLLVVGGRESHEGGLLLRLGRVPREDTLRTQRRPGDVRAARLTPSRLRRRYLPLRRAARSTRGRRHVRLGDRLLRPRVIMAPRHANHKRGRHRGLSVQRRYLARPDRALRGYRHRRPDVRRG